ncbi:MAG: DUF2779 domain-containing protein [Parcubacteria group bacterium]|nr:DUF2779 domain-containing protein [Parcubacteria group bacterium]
MLTKSDFIKFIQCKKYLWLFKNRKDLLPEEVDENLQKIFAEGYKIETYAYKLFPEGQNAQVEEFKESIFKTTKLVEEKAPTIFQPTFSAKNLFCRCDILKLADNGESHDIYEVKSSTSVKDINIYDMAFQKICSEGAGLKVGKIFIYHINNKYVRAGEIEPDKLLELEDVTDQVKHLEEETKLQIEKALKIIEGKDEPDQRILKQCDKPYECTLLGHCWKDIPKKSIYSIAGRLNEKKLNMLLDEGIVEIKDIPEGVVTSKAGLRHLNAEKTGEVHIEKDNIKDELEKLEYPLYFLDYETFYPGVPLFDGYRPYQHMTYQYSLHVQEKEGAELKHYEYLAKGWEDPSPGLAKELKKLIGKKGTVLAWNMSFEKGCNREMGERYPEFAEFFEDINNRMFDLMSIFRKGFYVHKDFHGGASIKKVLPVLCPDLSYSEMDIHEGATASNKWGDMIDPETSKQDAEKIYNDLIKYCELDTFAMVRILEELRKVFSLSSRTKR